MYNTVMTLLRHLSWIRFPAVILRTMGFIPSSEYYRALPHYPEPQRQKMMAWCDEHRFWKQPNKNVFWRFGPDDVEGSD